MNHFDYDNSPEGDWEDREDLIWNEGDWRQFLQRHDREVARFLSFYEKLRGQGEYLDEIAVRMGWDNDDWSHGDDLFSEEPVDMESRFDDVDEDTDPYTLHRHPVFVVTRALFAALRHNAQRYVKAEGNSITADFAWRFGEHLRLSESNAMMGIQALDMGDYALTVVHVKLALASLNDAMRMVQRIPAESVNLRVAYIRDSLDRMFDLREVWLRVMNDCRDEVRRRSRGGD